MQKTKQLLILLPFVIVAFIAFKPDSKDYGRGKIGKWYISVPDSMPPYNGLFWATKKGDTITISPYNSREYQVELDIDTEIWDGGRLVGKIPYDSASKFDQLMTIENE